MGTSTFRMLENMLSAIFSIKPEYVEKIFSNEKKFEFRTIVCKKQIKKILIYETSPMSKIVGEVLVSEILKDTPENIWERTKGYAGIDYSSYMNYFKNHKYAYAYVLNTPVKYKKPINLTDYNIHSPPQSFVYEE